MQPSVTFVTPSYRGDLERCRLLAESTSLFLPDDIKHLIIVDRRDLRLFEDLENDTVKIIEAESLLPWWIFRVPGIQSWWASLKSVPIRNWIYQQLIKISAINATDSDILQFIDSDVTLTRPFHKEYLFNGNKVRLQKTQYHSEDHSIWAKNAADLIGATTNNNHSNYIGSFITWRREHILGMIKAIEEVNKTSFVKAIASKIHFSEYMTYGAYIDQIVGIENSGHFYDNSPNIHMCYEHDLSTNQGIDNFFSLITPDHFGVMVHSKNKIPINNYREHIYSIWAQNT